MTLVAHNVSAAYGNKNVFTNLSFEIHPGQRLALVSPSGTGKSTLCRILAGYQQPQSGTVMLNGKDVSLPSHGVRPIQLIWQHPEQAFDPRLRIGISLKEALGSTHAELDNSMLKELAINPLWLTRFPHELSGGELMRMAVARALFACPQYLVCDEITASLDALTQAQVWHMLQRYACEHQMGMVFVSHSSALVRLVATDCFDLSSQSFTVCS